MGVLGQEAASVVQIGDKGADALLVPAASLGPGDAQLQEGHALLDEVGLEAGARGLVPERWVGVELPQDGDGGGVRQLLDAPADGLDIIEGSLSR